MTRKGSKNKEEEGEKGRIRRYGREMKGNCEIMKGNKMQRRRIRRERMGRIDWQTSERNMR